MVLYNMQNLTTKFTRTPDSPELIAQPKKRDTIEEIKKNNTVPTRPVALRRSVETSCGKKRKEKKYRNLTTICN